MIFRPKRTFDLRAFALGILATIVVAAAAAYVAVVLGLVPANADGPPLPGEKWAANRSLDATIRREMPRAPAPIPASAENLAAGAKLYGEDCIVCHGTATGAVTTIARGLYISAPRFGLRPRTRAPIGELYWDVRHGIRWTAMPSFAKTLSPTQMWQLALFLKNMKTLPPDVMSTWRSMKLPVPTIVAPALPSAGRRRAG